MNKIYKYPFDLSDCVSIEIPSVFKILKVAYQNDKLTMWAIVDTGSPERNIRLRIFGTGFEVPHTAYYSWQFLDTIFDPYGFVWHVFLEM